MFLGCEQVRVDQFVVKQLVRQLGLGGPFGAALATPLVAPLIGACMPWRKMLFRRGSS